MRIRNISITDRAAEVLLRQKREFNPGPGDVFALVYIASYINPDGTTVDGFRPGYMVSPLSPKDMGPGWVIAELSTGVGFHFEPRFKWSAKERYIMDRVSPVFAMFSIERAAEPREGGGWRRSS